MTKRPYSYLLILIIFIILAGCRSALVNAILNDRTERVKQLIDEGADINEKGKDNFTPLHWAAYYGKTEMVKILLSKGAEVNVRSETYGTPLTLAAQYGFTDTVKALLEKGADVNITDAHGRTALSYAEAEKNMVLIQLLTGSGAAPRESDSPPEESATATPALPPPSTERLKPVDKPARSAVSRSTSKINVTVFHFTPLNMDASNYGIKATNAMIKALETEPSFVMPGRKDLETFLVINDLQQNDHLENVINIGTRMGLNFVVAGNIEMKGSSIISTCSLFSIEQKKIIFTNKSISVGEANLISNITKMSEAIIEAILRSSS
jgi:hypothetical protein